MTSSQSMTSSIQHHKQQQQSQLKLYQILQNCKQIPKDDRLMLRKMIKDGDQVLISLLSDIGNKKLQVNVRKYLQRCKENRRNTGQGTQGRMNTIVDMKIVKDNRDIMGTPVIAKSKCRSATHSLEKNMSMCNLSNKKSIDGNQRRDHKDYRDHRDYRDMKESRQMLKDKKNIKDIREQLNQIQLMRSNSMNKLSSQCSRASVGNSRTNMQVNPQTSLLTYTNTSTNSHNTLIAAPSQTKPNIIPSTNTNTNTNTNMNKYRLQDNYLKQSHATYINSLLSPLNMGSSSVPSTTIFNNHTNTNTNNTGNNNNGLFTSPDLLNWHPPTSISTSTTNTIPLYNNIYTNLSIPSMSTSITNNNNNRSNTNSMANSRSSTINKSQLHQSFDISSSNIKPISTTTLPNNNWFIKSSLSSITGQDPSQKNLYNFKCALINHYAQDIFQFIVNKYFPSSIVQQSVYLPYRQLLKQVQTYLQNKGQQYIEIIKDNDIKVPLLEPFTNEYEGVSLKYLGVFLNKYCLHRNSSMRGIFIVLGVAENQAVTVDKFNKINSWKGQELVQAFQKLVNKCGEGNNISYWQVYRGRKQKQYIHFDNLYSKL